MRILVVNAGSSSLKLRVLEDDDAVSASEDLPVVGGEADRGGLQEAIVRFGSVDAVGHRIVHGGEEFTGPVVIDAGVRRRLEALTDLAPLHQPKSLAALDAVQHVLPDPPAVACFDTAFHATMPAAAATYALPREWRVRWGLRRFGFHGLSHAYASRRTAELLGRPAADLRIVTCHLGSGASLAAVQGGRSVDTTMGFTPLEGLVMSTRSGTVDPGLVLWLEDHVGMPSAELASTLEHRSGLAALAGTGDMRSILAARDAGDENAALAVGVYAHRLRSGIASMAAAMGGADAITFTGGVGENSPAIRAEACAGLGFLGVRIDQEVNRAIEDDGEMGVEGSAVRAVVVHAREDLEIARQVREVLG